MLTVEQAELIGDGPVRGSGDQTDAQAMNCAVAAVRFRAQLEGIDVPDTADVRAELERLIAADVR